MQAMQAVGMVPIFIPEQPMPTVIQCDVVNVKMSDNSMIMMLRVAIHDPAGLKVSVLPLDMAEQTAKNILDAVKRVRGGILVAPANALDALRSPQPEG